MNINVSKRQLCHPTMLDTLARVIEQGIEPADGALELLRTTRDALPVALCSGSRRREIDLILAGRVQVGPFVERHPMSSINDVFAAVHEHRIDRRPVLVPDFD